MIACGATIVYYSETESAVALIMIVPNVAMILGMYGWVNTNSNLFIGMSILDFVTALVIALLMTYALGDHSLSPYLIVVFCLKGIFTYLVADEI
jgi:hypothetical protein